MVTQLPLWKTNPIQYLINEKFPELVAFRRSATSNRSKIEEQNRLQTVEKVAVFRDALNKKPSAEIAKLVEEAQNREAKKYQKMLEKWEAEASYNQPNAEADFAYWSRISYWTLDESVALSMGKNPKIVTWEKLKGVNYHSPFVTKYAEKREAILRAKTMGQLWDTTAPAVFMAWAARTRFEMPPDLVMQVQALGLQVADWKTLCDEKSEANAILQKQLSDSREKSLTDSNEHLQYIEQQGAKFDSLSKGYNEVISLKDQHISQLNDRIAKLETAKSAQTSKPVNDLPPRERDSLLKLLIGMAIRGYSYDPKANRSTRTKEIADDLRAVGVELDEDTVRKYLNEAKALLPNN